jgi:hypothetical protein
LTVFTARINHCLGRKQDTELSMAQLADARQEAEIQCDVQLRQQQARAANAKAHLDAMQAFWDEQRRATDQKTALDRENLGVEFSMRTTQVHNECVQLDAEFELMQTARSKAHEAEREHRERILSLSVHTEHLAESISMTRAHNLHSAVEREFLSQTTELTRLRNLISHLQAEKLLLEEDTYRAIAQRNYMEDAMKKQRIADAISNSVDRAEILQSPPPPTPTLPLSSPPTPLQEIGEMSLALAEPPASSQSSLQRETLQARPPPPPPSSSTSVLRIVDTDSKHATKEELALAMPQKKKKQQQPSARSKTRGALLAGLRSGKLAKAVDAMDDAGGPPETKGMQDKQQHPVLRDRAPESASSTRSKTRGALLAGLRSGKLAKAVDAMDDAGGPPETKALQDKQPQQQQSALTLQDRAPSSAPLALPAPSVRSTQVATTRYNASTLSFRAGIKEQGTSGKNHTLVEKDRQPPPPPAGILKVAANTGGNGDNDVLLEDAAPLLALADAASAMPSGNRRGTVDLLFGKEELPPAPPSPAALATRKTPRAHEM